MQTARQRTSARNAAKHNAALQQTQKTPASPYESASELPGFFESFPGFRDPFGVHGDVTAMKVLSAEQPQSVRSYRAVARAAHALSSYGPLFRPAPP
ncbi:hypothetical protein [Paraburkholderia sp. J94]|uniref:hypothetical protein n=1 Tax=Paraburkholderia sp. J94 TaxID=2805441 RepID=UPI002AB03C62|nr:hypothetical protein [Paraburkholderia sp. J94]